VEKYRRVTEEDLQVTEAMIAESYGRLTQSVAKAPSRGLRYVEQTIRKHPFETAAAAIVVGIIAYALTRPKRPRIVFDKVDEQPHVQVKKAECPDLMKEIVSVVIPLAIPYISGYIQNYMSEIHSRRRD
jgi:hypothetical protein